MMMDSNFAHTTDPMLSEQQLKYSVYCATCGYNLRHASYVGRCPECGSDYNARPLKLENIFVEGALRFPSSEVFIGLFCTLIGGWLVPGAINPVSFLMLPIAVIMVLIGLAHLVTAYRRFIKYLRYRSILKRSQEEKDD